MFEGNELAAADCFLASYSTYFKCLQLKVPVTASDIDNETLNILYTIHSKLDELREAKRSKR